MKANVLTKWTALSTMAALLTACVSTAAPVATAPVVTTPVTNATNTVLNGLGGLSNTTIGAGSGAALGGIIGAAVSKNGKKNEGALIGAAIGGVLGGVIGNQYGTQIKGQVDRIGGILNGTGSTATTMPDGSLKINLAGDLSFNSGSAVIKESFVNTLDKVAKVIAETPNGRVVVVGHTDSTGNAEANQRLSLARANTVRDFLATSGVSNARITTYGRGSTQPAAANDTEAGRALNRRVEIFVFPENK